MFQNQCRETTNEPLGVPRKAFYHAPFLVICQHSAATWLAACCPEADFILAVNLLADPWVQWKFAHGACRLREWDNDENGRGRIPSVLFLDNK